LKDIGAVKSEKVTGLSIRGFSETELNNPDYYRWMIDYDNVKYIGRPEYLSLCIPFSKVEEYVVDLVNSNNDYFFAAYFLDDFIGTIKIGHINWENLVADMGFLIGNKKCRGKGFGTEILRLGCRFAFEDLRLRKLEGGCFASNIPANRMFLRTGFLLEGVLRDKLKIEDSFDDHNLYGLFHDELILL